MWANIIQLAQSGSPQNILHFSSHNVLFYISINSACSGVVSATLGTPADVIKTRMMNQPYGPDGKGLLYRSTLNCLVQTVRDEYSLCTHHIYISCYPYKDTMQLVINLIFSHCMVKSQLQYVYTCTL
jgi:hypothetical protein